MKKLSSAVVITLALISILLQTPARAQTSDASTIIDLVGGKFTKIFSTFGTPADLYTIRGTNAADDYVVVDYPSFGFKVRGKVVHMAIFWKEYTGGVNGIHIGDNKSDILNKMGNTDDIQKNSDGSVSYFWPTKDYYFGVVFDENDRVTMIKVETK
ncbi:MAG: hypothetical protein ACP5US_11485 [Candidatus Kryptoniota bacterium]